MKTLTKLKTAGFTFLLARLACFGHLCLINDLPINFRIPGMD